MTRIRYILVLVFGVLAGARTVEAVHAWREWRNRSAQDPVGAQAYRNFLLTNLGTILLSLCLAALLWRLLRPKEAGSGQNQ